MADQDENEHNSGEPPVISSLDIESMQVRLLIICNNERLLENVAVFLNRRGWETKVTANLKEAMASATTLKPDFVLISANHQNTRLMRLPLALKQTLQIPTIGFCETGDARTLGILQQLPVDHRLMGHVSGPNVQRRIRQILQQMHNPDTASTERRMASLGDNASDLVAIKGGGEREKTDFKMFSRDASVSDNQLLNGVVEDRDLPTIPPAASNSPPVTQDVPRRTDESDLMISFSAEEIAAIIEGIKKDFPSDSDQPAPEPRHHEVKRDTVNATYFEKLVVKLLNELETRAAREGRKLQLTDQITLVHVQDPKNSGFLVFAQSSTQRTSEELTGEFMSALASFLRKEGKLYEFTAPAHLTVEEHHFFEWERDKVMFNHVRPVDDGDLAVKFVPSEEMIPKLTQHTKDGKLVVDADVISTQFPADFKIYLHLEKNERYVVLVKEGGVLHPKYKERLKENGKSLYIDKEALELFKRYYAAAAGITLLNLRFKDVKYSRERTKKSAA